MGMLRRIVDAIVPREERAKEVSWDALRGAIDTGGELVSARTAENLSCVMACVGAISSAMASLPARIYRTTDAGRIEEEQHPIARLIANGPNQYQSWPDW